MPPVCTVAGVPQGATWPGSGAAYGVRHGLRRTESQRAVEGRERSGVEAPCEPPVSYDYELKHVIFPEAR